MLSRVKDYLKITWIDDDELIVNFISRGQAVLNGLAGAGLDFQEEGLARSLLFDYCRYAYNNATEYFEENYQREIMRLQLMAGIKELDANED